MTALVTGRVWENSGATGGTLLVLLAIADQANGEGVAWLLQETLAAKTRQSEKTVERAIDWLQENYELDVWRYPPRRGGPARLGYRVLLGDLQRLAGVEPDELLERAKGERIELRVTPTQRRDTLARDGGQCRCCGTRDGAVKVVQVQAAAGRFLVTVCTACSRELPVKLSGSSPDILSGIHPTICPSRPDTLSGIRAGVTSAVLEPSGTVTLAAPADGGRERELRDLVAGVLSECFSQPSNDAERGRQRKAASLIVESLAAAGGPVDYQRVSDEVARRFKRWGRLYPQARLTDIALANHWAELAPRAAATVGIDVATQAVVVVPDVSAEQMAENAARARAALDSLRLGAMA